MGNVMYNYNPYLAQSSVQMPSYGLPPQRCEIVRVTGENGARAYAMAPSSSALLLDESNPVVWLVTTDGAGYKTVEPFDIKKHEPLPAPDFGAMEARLKRLEELYESNFKQHDGQSQ